MAPKSGIAQRRSEAAGSLLALILDSQRVMMLQRWHFLFMSQVRAFSTELAFVALERWKRDALAVAGSVVGLARLFLMLRFHPRLSLVTDVLAASVVHLAHFFIMFFMVVGVYRYL